MLISICIPAYTRLNYLIELVNACKVQTQQNFEVCISQDRTKDGLNEGIRAFCQELTDNDKRFKYFPSTESLGLAGNWNALTCFASGDYIFMPGDDDLILPNFIEEISKVIELHKPDVIFTNQRFIDADGEVLADYTKKQNIFYHRAELMTGLLPEPVVNVFNNTIPMSASVIKKSWLQKFPFDNKLNTPELEVFLKIAIAGGSFYYINKQLADYRVHPASATSSGLTIDRFVKNILAIEVPLKYKQAKLDFLSTMIVVACNKAIKRGDKTLALVIWNHKSYYPSGSKIKRWSQKLLLTLPSSLLVKLFS